jgi:hypothetical protein
MRKSMLSGLSVLLFAVSTQALAQAPQPGPEVKKLEAWVGVWRYEGNAKASPMGPAAKIAGTQTGRMVMNGFALEWKAEEKGAFGGVQWGEMDAYDASAKNYPFFGYQNDGTIWWGDNAVSGNTWKVTQTIISKGTHYMVRGAGSFSADGKTYTWKVEISSDGKTWAPWTEGTMTKSM